MDGDNPGENLKPVWQESSKNLGETSVHGEGFSELSIKNLKDLEGPNKDDQNLDSQTVSFAIDLGFKKSSGKVDHIKKNIVRVMNPKSILKIIHEANPPLLSQNIPSLANSTGFTRGELHTIYILYKSLCQVTSQRYGKLEYDVADGIDDHVFRRGVYQVFIQSDEIAQRIFNAIDYNLSHFMNWPEFISGMQMIRAKTLSDKLALFIKLADEDGNGLLDSDEITEFCQDTLSRFVKPETNPDFLEELVAYFRKIIFEIMGYSEDQQIPLEEIKEYILAGKQDSHLLVMFCGANF